MLMKCEGITCSKLDKLDILYRSVDFGNSKELSKLSKQSVLKIKIPTHVKKKRDLKNYVTVWML